MLLYRVALEENPSDPFVVSLQEELNSSIYHYFKGFFHKHLFHDEEADPILPVWSSLFPTIFDSDARKQLLRDIVDKYVLQYEGFHEQIQYTVENAFNRVHQSEEISKNLHVIGQNLKILTNLLYETEYSLNLFHLFPEDISRNRKQELRHRISLLRDLHKRVSFHYNLIAQSISIDLGISGKNWGVAGVIIGIISIILSILL